MLELPAEQIRVMVPDVGGGFGPKGSIYPEEMLVAAAALKTGRPVKWISGRGEDLVTSGHDRDQVHEAKIGFKRDGTIVAVDDSFLADVGAYPIEGEGLTLNTVNHFCAPYRVANFRSQGKSVVTNKTLNGAYRGAGRPEANFVMERLMDIGARRLGIDPAELRRRNLVRPTEMPYKPGLIYKDGTPIAYDPADFPGSFDRALALLGYDEWRRRQKAQPERPAPPRHRRLLLRAGLRPRPVRGRNRPRGPERQGLRLHRRDGAGAGARDDAGADRRGRAGRQLRGRARHGGRHDASSPSAWARAAAASWPTRGPAVAQTAREVKQKAQRVAAELLEAAPEDIRIERGEAFVAGVPNKSVTARAARAGRREVQGAEANSGEPGLNACTYFYPGTVTWAFGTQAAVVDVDVESCRVRLLAYAVVHDPGRAINPGHRRGPAPGRRRPGPRRRAPGRARLRRSRTTPDGLLHGLLHPQVRRRAGHPAWRSPSTARSSTRSASRAWARAAPSRARRPSSTPWKTRSAEFGVVLREAPATPARIWQALQEAASVARRVAQNLPPSPCPLPQEGVEGAVWIPRPRRGRRQPGSLAPGGGEGRVRGTGRSASERLARRGREEMRGR